MWTWLPPTDITSCKCSKDVIFIHLIGKFSLLYCCIAVSWNLKSVNIVSVLTWVRQADYILSLWIVSLSLFNSELAVAFLVLKKKRKFWDEYYLLPVLKCTAILLFPVTRLFISLQILCIIPALKRYFAIRVLSFSRPFFVFFFFFVFFLSSGSNHIFAARDKNS